MLRLMVIWCAERRASVVGLLEEPFVDCVGDREVESLILVAALGADFVRVAILNLYYRIAT